MSKNKSAKYKITDTDIDKKFIGKQVTVEKVKAKGGPGGDGGRKPGSTNKITLAKLAEQMADLTKTVKDGFAEQAKLNKTIISRIDRIVKVNNLKE